MDEIIDAHHHLWHYSLAQFGWIGPEMDVLQRNFLSADLNAEISRAGVTGTVAVQARQSLAETRWLLECASATSPILGVVGWVPLSDAKLPAILQTLRDEPKLRGVRHVVQDEPDDDFILGGDFNRGVSALLDTGLAYDLLIHEHHLPQATLFAQRHPQQRMVLDHLAKPKIASRTMEPWRSRLMRLADCPNVCCKVSGLVTEADWATWSPDDLAPYLDVALEAFGPERLMAGSDWPVCLVASSYTRWWSTLFQWAQGMPAQHHASFFGGAARSFYKLAAAAEHPFTVPGSMHALHSLQTP